MDYEVFDGLKIILVKLKEIFLGMKNLGLD